MKRIEAWQVGRRAGFPEEIDRDGEEGAAEGASLKTPRQDVHSEDCLAEGLVLCIRRMGKEAGHCCVADNKISQTVESSIRRSGRLLSRTRIEWC